MKTCERYLEEIKARLAKGHCCVTCGAPATLKVGDSVSRYYQPVISIDEAKALVAMVECAREAVRRILQQTSNQIAREALAQLDLIASGETK